MIVFLYSLNDLKKYVCSSMANNAKSLINDDNQLKTIFSIATDYGHKTLIDHNKLDEAIDKVTNLYKDLHYEKNT